MPFPLHWEEHRMEADAECLEVLLILVQLRNHCFGHSLVILKTKMCPSRIHVGPASSVVEMNKRESYLSLDSQCLATQ